MTDLAIIGCGGRMGQALIQALARVEDLRVVAAVETAGAASLGQDAGVVAGLPPLGVPIVEDLHAALGRCSVAIDFSAPASSLRTAEAAAQHGARLALVIGTTGLDATQRQALQHAATRTAIVHAPNMSVGVNVLLRLAAEAARLLGPDFDLEIVEAHHRHKKDAPSGTAARLAEVLAAATATQGSLDERACYGRHGLSSRAPREIGIHAVRGGDIVGDHTVLYCADGERIELTHRASSRQTFAQGALRAARWVAGRAAGLYDMQDVLGLTAPLS
ncbi:MAG: 4-hydroxy-tetrahydrodipicolinate reductase [Proteobacteria bacterium]|jgi:4-hydroxy-tetrahydrodipicolinate reductase|nr:4-hydroxy-tetrahydrodipicolinate reductase [Pseudomonadota bacterium]